MKIQNLQEMRGNTENLKGKRNEQLIRWKSLGNMQNTLRLIRVKSNYSTLIKGRWRRTQVWRWKFDRKSNIVWKTYRFIKNSKNLRRRSLYVRDKSFINYLGWKLNTRDKAVRRVVGQFHLQNTFQITYSMLRYAQNKLYLKERTRVHWGARVISPECGWRSDIFTKCLKYVPRLHRVL